ncbi:hypothetical protein F2Q69_00013736 [Brassica cretica]|uniref:RNase H type-1 domain-containing protein n=1 Tax=Brassica cretica TaxID=69181 RepID=A0A8S9QYM0_BRACR|nr:hypothetical protein F2Q69_00013736 [Brassica cretica]
MGHGHPQHSSAGLDRQVWECSTYGLRNCIRHESALHSEVEALRWAMENMIQYSTCQSFGTDCKELIAMIKKPHVWPSFATELERIETLQICFLDFKITHILRAQIQIYDSLARTARVSSLRRLGSSGLDPKSQSIKTLFGCLKLVARFDFSMGDADDLKIDVKSTKKLCTVTLDNVGSELQVINNSEKAITLKVD